MPPVDPGNRRRWWVLTATAALALFVVVIVLSRSEEPRPAPTAAGPGGVVPSVFGLTRSEAVSRLERADLVVNSRPLSQCEVDQQALGTVPAGDEPVPGDRTVTLTWAESSNLDCPGITERIQAWELVGFLDGRRPAPSFSATVPLLTGAGGRAPRILTAAQAGDPSTWLPADLRTALDSPGAVMTASTTSNPSCPSGLSDDVDTNQGFLSVEIDHDRGRDSRCSPRIDLRTEKGEITMIGVDVTGAASLVSLAPDLVGLPEDEARAAAAASVPDAVTSVVYREKGCGTSGRVTSQRPDAGSRVRGSVSLVIDVDRADCGAPSIVSDVQRAVAEQLVSWAGGTGAAPALADPVELYVGHADAGSVEAAAMATAWRGCPADAAAYDVFDCPVALLGGVAYDVRQHRPTEVVARAEPLPCGGGLVAARVPDRIRALASFFVVPQGGGSCLDGYRLQVFLDVHGRIAAVDVLVSSP